MIYRGRLWILALLVCTIHGARFAIGQVFEVSAGASTSYGAEGGTVTIEGTNSKTILGAGIIEGHFAAGGSSSRAFAQGTLTTGQESFRMDLPTDIFDTSHTLYGTGVGYVSKLIAGNGVEAFAGFGSQEGGTPLFQTSSLNQATLYGRWSHPLPAGCSWILTGLHSTESVVLGSLACRHSRALRYALTLGSGGGSPYIAGSIVFDQRRLKVKAAYIHTGQSFQRANDIYQPTPEPVKENVSVDYYLTPSFTLSGTHGNYQTPPPYLAPASAAYLLPVHSSLDTASLQFQRISTGAGASFLHSRASQLGSLNLMSFSGENSAFTLNFHTSLGRILWNENLLCSLNTGQAGNSVLLNGIDFNFNPHLHLTESVNISGGSPTFSHGGILLTRYSTFEVDYQLFYIATRPQQPFQQAMVFDAQVRLPKDLALHAASTVDSTGRTRYTIQLNTSFDHDKRLPEPISARGLGTNLLEGRVVDPSGGAVEGAVLLIGQERVYTGHDGTFFFRERRARTHDFRVLTDEFQGIGTYAVKSAPTSVKSSSNPALLTIVVDRPPETSPKDSRVLTAQTARGPSVIGKPNK